MDLSRDRVTDGPSATAAVSSPADGGDAEAADGKTPDYGLLSRTLVHSSVVKQILPARIRRADYANDVVFVGETYVELHLLTDTRKLLKVGSKTGFGAEIRDAKVFGTQRKVNPSGVRGGDVLRKIKDEDEDDEGHMRHHPPDILALTLDSGELAFLYAKDSSEQGQVEFVESRRRIGMRGVHPSHLGKSIAVDPRSRAMAVTSYQESFRMYSLHPMEELHRQMEEGLPLNPIKEEKTFQVQGCVIVHAEFLYPSRDDPDRVMLLLFLVDSKQASRLQLYEWLTTKPLSTARKHGFHGLKLSPDVTLPLHVIPVSICSAFLIVTETCIFVAKALDIMSGNAVFDKIAVPGDPAGKYQSSLITSWARPFRDSTYRESHDDLYVAQENGDVFFLEVEEGSHTIISTLTLAIKLDCSVGTAFAAVDFGLGHNDVLVAGGEMSSGGIYTLSVGVFAAGDGANREESVQNWAPVIDFQLANLQNHGQGIGADRDRVYACTGRGQHGAITELRYGIQANILYSAEYLPSIGQLFVLPDAAQQGYFVLSSLPVHSQLCFLTPAGDWIDCGEIEGLDLSERTLVARGLGRACKPENGEYSTEKTRSTWSVQITPGAVTVVQLNSEVHVPPDEDVETDGLRNGVCRKLQRRCENGDRIIAAATLEENILIAIRNGTEVKLILATVDVTADSDQFLKPVGAPILLEEDPTFVDIQILHNQPLAMVGTSHATLQLFLCDMSNGLVPVIEQTMVDPAEPVEHVLSVCESAVIIGTSNAAKLLCGLRGGTVIVFDVSTSENSIQLTRGRVVKFGPIPVRLHLDVKRTDSAFVLAGPELYRFDMPAGEFRAAQICFNDTADFYPSVRAFTQVDNTPDIENIIICATSEHILLADVGHSQRICGTRFKLQETPRRVMYYKTLKVFLVACSRTEHDDRLFGGDRSKLWCSLRIIDSKTGESRAQDEPLRDSSKKELIFNKPNEQIFGIVEWNMTINDKPYSYIAIGTGSINTPNKKGRVLILYLRENAEGKIETKLCFQINCEGPVYSLAAYGSHSIVFCSSSTLHLRTLDPVTKKLESTATYHLRSPCVALTVREPYLHLSLASDSLLIIRYSCTTQQLEPLFSDCVARNGLFHTPIFPNLILATDKRNAVVGFYQPHTKRSLESLTTIFEATLSSSVSRIRIGSCRAPWSAGRKATIPGVVNGSKTMIAAGVDGSFFQLTLITKQALALLRHIQEMYMLKTGTTSAYSHPESQDGEEYSGGRVDPKTAHVNGDLLAPVIKLGAGWLREAVGAGSEVAFARFVDAAGEVLGEGLQREAEKGDVFEKVVEYVDRLLNDAVL